MPTAVVTLTTSGTNYRLDQLLSGAVGSTNNPYPALAAGDTCLRNVRELVITNQGVGAAKIAITNGLASPSVAQGITLAVGQGYPYRTQWVDIPLIDKFLVTDTNGTTVVVTWTW
jgi:glycine/D-amino acid oxidase-like deaminating enzyme